MTASHSCPTCGHPVEVSETIRQFLAGEPVGGVHLTPTERTVLQMLAEKSMTHQELVSKLYDLRRDPPLWADGSVDVVLCRLRKKLGPEVVPRREYKGLQMVRIEALERVLAA